jgi:hypothetical protein
MAGAATEVALHCMICYEEFDLKDRHPVVLPCGHTYVCIVCAKRLKKCMECREPLFWNPPRPLLSNSTRSPAAQPRYARGRMSAARYSPSPATPPHPAMNNPPEKKEEHPLPLPKNVVLMEMIEAKERQQRLLQEARREEQEALLRKQEKQLQQLQEQLEGDGNVVANMNLMDDEVDEEDEEDELLLDPALSGMAAFTGACGTYAVREPLGLVVLPQDPNRKHQQPAASPGASPAPTSHAGAVAVFGFEQELEQDHKLAAAPQPQAMPFDDDEDDHDEKKESVFEEDENDNQKPVNSRREPFSLHEGQKVQVVGVEEGVYQLARGAGYIVATVNQLVKGRCMKSWPVSEDLDHLVLFLTLFFVTLLQWVFLWKCHASWRECCSQ